MEGVVSMHAFAGVFRGARVLVTGHTGFKGSWLTQWLIELGADVHGFALVPPTSESLFSLLRLEGRMNHIVGDIRDLAALQRCVSSVKPVFVFHLAAQPLVRASYADPAATFHINVLGTANVLEAVRVAGQPCSIVAVTTDKCYENQEWVYSYREEDPMGGHDPYSASKGAAEIIISSYRRSFFETEQLGIRLASARAGNVIGGGDWSTDRIVPDAVRALQRGQAVRVRNPRATRPWQHVLEPLSGYLWLAAALSVRAPSSFPVPVSRYCGPFNFGPGLDSNRSVEELVREILRFWPGEMYADVVAGALHEASLLNLATDKAYHLLKWSPVWEFTETISNTIDWYRSVKSSQDADHVTREQLSRYVHRAADLGLAWAK